jgi:hypothetical protein
MITLIDYYSYTIPLKEPLGKGMFDSDKQFVIQTFLDNAKVFIFNNGTQDNWETEKAKGFYTTRLRHSPTDVALSYGFINSHIFVELAGLACANFDRFNLLFALIERTHERATRIDFAVDILTDVTPKEFIEKRSNTSFKSSGNKYSPSGGTEYLGGRSSERMARVYRYYFPHPRHEYLRVETEYKGDAAKASAKHLIKVGTAQASVDAHQPFGWTHPIWDIERLKAERITYKTYRPDTASTLLWLYGDVVTAMRKAVKEGLIDFEDWLKFFRGVPKDEN